MTDTLALMLMVLRSCLTVWWCWAVWCYHFGAVCSTGRKLAFIMAALHNRCGHYIFALWFLSFFPRLISAVADWMFTILRHMMWP